MDRVGREVGELSARASRRTGFLAGPVGTALCWALAGLACLAARSPSLGGWGVTEDGTPCVFLVDLSDSAVRHRTGGAARWRGSWVPALRGARPGEKISLYVYGNGARRIAGPVSVTEAEEQLDRWVQDCVALSTPGEGPGGEPHFGSGSELDGGLALVEDLLLGPDSQGGRLVHFGDGKFSGPDPSSRLARWSRAGIGIQHVEPPEADLDDLRLSALRTRKRVEVGAPTVVEVDVHWDASRWGSLPRSVALLAEVTGPGGTRSHRRGLDPGAFDGSNSHRVRWDLGPAPEGTRRIEVRVVGEPRDPSPENQVRTTVVRAEGLRRVGWTVGPEPAQVGFLGGPPWEREIEGIEWVPIPWDAGDPGGFGAQLFDLDAWVSAGIPLESLDGALLSTWIEGGRGWWHLGGEIDLVPGNWGTSGVQDPRESPGVLATELLPLEPQPPEPRGRDIVLLVDGSGSMVGEPFAELRTALHRLLDQAPLLDGLRVRVFTDTLGPELILRPPLDGTEVQRGSEETRRSHRAVEALGAPGGPTDAVAALAGIADALGGSDRRSLVVVLSDGQDGGESTEPGSLARGAASMRAQGVELTPIAVGTGADTAVLEQLVAPGERLVRASDGEQLTRVLHSVLHRDGIGQGEGLLPVTLEPGGEQSPRATSLRTELASNPWPALDRWLRVDLRPGCDSLVALASGEVLAGMGDHGRGWTLMTVGLDPGARARGKLDLAPWIRALAAGEVALSVELERAEGGAWVLVRGLDPGDWKGTTARIGSPGEPAVELRLEPWAQGRDLDPRTGRRAWIDGAGLARLQGADRVLELAFNGPGAPPKQLIGGLPCSEWDSMGGQLDFKVGSNSEGRAAIAGGGPGGAWLLGLALVLGLLPLLARFSDRSEGRGERAVARPGSGPGPANG